MGWGPACQRQASKFPPLSLPPTPRSSSESLSYLHANEGLEQLSSQDPPVHPASLGAEACSGNSWLLSPLTLLPRQCLASGKASERLPGARLFQGVPTDLPGLQLALH